MIQSTVDREANAAYLVLTAAVVVRTVSVNESIFVDLDENDVAVGVEVLGLNRGSQPSANTLEHLESLGVSLEGREALISLLSGGAA